MTVQEFLRHGTLSLRQAGISEARSEARLLLGYVLGIGKEAIVADPSRVLKAREIENIENCFARRARREPISQIVGRREFWGLPFQIDRSVLDPRPDSETIVRAALMKFRDRAPGEILDLGAGSGCLLLSLLHEFPSTVGVGVDISPSALATAAKNAAALGLQDRVHFVCGNWASALVGRFDLIVCNPPYIPTTSIGELERDVRCYEPHIALDGGIDGLECYRRLLPQIGSALSTTGIAILEAGANQAKAVASLAKTQRLTLECVVEDFGHRPRCVIFSRTTKN